jgi:hypothetical protein
MLCEFLMLSRGSFLLWPEWFALILKNFFQEPNP